MLFAPAYGALFIGEVDYTPDKFTKLMAGAWELTSRLPDFGQFNGDGSQRMIYGGRMSGPRYAIARAEMFGGV